MSLNTPKPHPHSHTYTLTYMNKIRFIAYYLTYQISRSHDKIILTHCGCGFDECSSLSCFVSAMKQISITVSIAIHRSLRLKINLFNFNFSKMDSCELLLFCLFQLMDHNWRDKWYSAKTFKNEMNVVTSYEIDE